MSHVRPLAQPNRRLLLSHSFRRTSVRNRSAPRRRYATEGSSSPSPSPQAQAQASPQPEHIGPADNPFNRERAAVKHHAAKTADLWRKLTFYVAIPSMIIGGANAYTLYTEHEEHLKHGPPLEDRVEYSYMNIRTKNFFWGDGDKTLFWNDKYNYHKKD